ncbi:MAG: FG-GAP-like repeat-containing protein [Phycisphaerales bacterium]
MPLLLPLTVSMTASLANASSPSVGMSRFSNIYHSTVSRPLDHVCADLDGDSYLDIAVISKYGLFEVRYGAGDGSFSEPTEYDVGMSAARIVAADLNADQLPDLAITHDEQDTVSILMNDGQGRFSDHVIIDCPGKPTDLVAFDADQDGDMDLAIACFDTDEVRVFENHGGSFLGNRSFAAGDGPSRLVSADVNQDGDPDLIVSNMISDDIRVFLQSSSGFGMSQRLLTGLHTNALAVADFDLDGDPDLASVSSTSSQINELRIHRNQAGVFGLPEVHDLGNQPVDLVAGHLDADGHVDLAIAVSNEDHIEVRLNDGTGGFHASEKHYTAHDPRSIALGDLDGDSDLDLSVAILFQSTFYTQSIENDGRGRFHAFHTALDIPIGGFAQLVDLNLDNNDDVVWAESGRIVIHLADGQGGHEPPLYLETVGHHRISHFADLDQDGFPDIVSVDWAEESMSVFWGGEQSVFQQRTVAEVGFQASGFRPHDVDLDGDLDMLVSRRFNGSDYLLRNKGNRTFHAEALEGTPGAFGKAALLDLDGDRDLDLVRTNSTWIWRYENDGDGHFTEVSQVLVGSINEIHATDIDTDGFSEIVVLTSDGLFQADFVSLSEIELTPVWTYGAELRYGDLNFQDLDGDGDIDIFFQTTADTGRVLTNTGAGAFRAGEWFSTPFGTLRFSDHDDDGDLDLFGGQLFLTSLVVVENLFEPACVADIDLDSVASFADVSLFIELFVSNRPGADINRDGAIDAADVMDFLQAYSAGCAD